jgi:hypothetical protein
MGSEEDEETESEVERRQKKIERNKSQQVLGEAERQHAPERKK